MPLVRVEIKKRPIRHLTGFAGVFVQPINNTGASF